MRMKIAPFIHRTYPCEICGKVLSDPRNLRQHMTLHTGKPYKCAYCDKTYTAKHVMMMHQRKHAAQKSYTL